MNMEFYLSESSIKFILNPSKNKAMIFLIQLPVKIIRFGIREKCSELGARGSRKSQSLSRDPPLHPPEPVRGRLSGGGEIELRLRVRHISTSPHLHFTASECSFNSRKHPVGTFCKITLIFCLPF
jgi:hypothetical protein